MLVMAFDIMTFHPITWFELYILHKIIIIEISLEILDDN